MRTDKSGKSVDKAIPNDAKADEESGRKLRRVLHINRARSYLVDLIAGSFVRSGVFLVIYLSEAKR